jgi:LmbE family N-acetylglucosaminyl deacetylase
MALIIWAPSSLFAQLNKPNAAEIHLDLKKLNSLGSVLYVAAHPDDENTQLIAYLSNEALLNTAYLSVTRGDGGQNLIGPEIREMLGVIRTQELLQARRIDGGQQFFTRANDFGYSKSPEEALKIWDKEKVLADVVWVIRKFQPEVIITRFPPDGRGRHGHHTASAILAEEAFDAAADPNRFPEQLLYVKPWQTRSLLFNTSWWFYGGPENFNSEGMIAIDVGAYNHLLGKSYTEIAAESRSMHKSQGFGSSGTRGETFDYLEHVKGEKITANYFQEPIRKWEDIKGGSELKTMLNQAYEAYDPEHPGGIVPLLVEAKQLLKNLQDPYWRQVKQKQIDDLIQATLGLYLEASTLETAASPGESIKIKLEATNRSEIPIVLKNIDLTGIEGEVKGVELGNNQSYDKELNIQIPSNQPYSQPYWLRSTGSLGMFEVSDPQMIGQAENGAALSVPFEVSVMEESIIYDVPLVHKRNDPVKGEIFQPLAITPAVAINFQDKVLVFADETPRELMVTVISGKPEIKGELQMQVPDGWKVTPENVSFELAQKGEEHEMSFTIVPPLASGEGKIKAVATVGGETFSMEQRTIEYDHIPNQLLLPEAAAKVVKLDIVSGGYDIGYVMGAGDDIPNSLRQIGYTVDLLEPNQLNGHSLDKYRAIILGIRALNTVERLKYQMENLFSYVARGGTLIVQYNTSHRLVTQNIAPYPLKLSRDRVSVEEAPVEFSLPDHPVLNAPNQITQADFEGWVQERGLYFPDEWGDQFQAVLSTGDPGESPKNGGLLVAKYGEGHYVYTGLSWFRELPAGVPGAYRLFANLISLGLQQPEN